MLISMQTIPISYFDTNPSGRILNRFSNDKSMGDYMLILALYDVLELNSFFFVSAVFIMILQPIFISIIFVTVLI
jgi:ATP-binding cassette subfamily C (CFTR/MRP) protein 4